MICKKCGLDKPEEYFYKIKKNSLRRRKTCKDCSLIEKLVWKKTAAGKENESRYYSNNIDKLREKSKLRSRNYRKNNKKKCNTYRSWYEKNTPNGRLRRKRRKLKRERQLGFIPINEKFEGSVAHHLDDKYVIYILEDIHKKYSGYSRDMHRLLVLNELFVEGIIL